MGVLSTNSTKSSKKPECAKEEMILMLYLLDLVSIGIVDCVFIYAIETSPLYFDQDTLMTR